MEDPATATEQATATDDAPYADGAAQLADHVERVRLCVQRHRLIHPLPRRRQLLAGAPSEPQYDKAERVEAEIAALDGRMAARLGRSSGREGYALQRLAARFALSDMALRLLVAAAVPGLDLELARDFTPDADEPELRQPDVAFLVELLARDPGERDALLAEVAAGAALVRWRLVRLGPARGWSPEAPLLQRTVAVPERVVGWLRAGGAAQPEVGNAIAPGFDEGLDAWVRLWPVREGQTTSSAVLEKAFARALFRPSEAAAGTTLTAGDAATAAAGGGATVPLLVVGPALSGKASALIAVAARAGRPTLEVDLDGLSLSAQPGERLVELQREARLLGALLVVRHGEALTDARPALRLAVSSLLANGETPVVLTSREELPDFARRVRGLETLRVVLPDHDEQLRLWQIALPPSVARAADLDLAVVIHRYRLAPGDILEAGAQAIAQARQRSATASDAAVTLDDVIAAARARLRHRLRDVAELLATPLTWSDLVVRDHVRQRIDELLATVKHATMVMDTWDFARKVAYGRAVSALFSGPPGTGKTMVATLIAKELGLELFRVDLSRVVSKWVGETEKNLGRAFDEASNSQAVLLFDEADALFAKRTEVKSSNDRYANLEVNFLLQRLESFDGIVILTTNHASAVDDAFRRRLRFRIEFPKPDEDERVLLWKAMLPPKAPVAADVDFALLARRFQMAGGYIKNAVVRAAFLAANKADQRLDHATLLRAANLEWEDMGNLSMERS